MVFIRKIEKVEAFLQKFNEKFPPSEEEKTNSNNKFIELSKLESYVSKWNVENPEKNFFLHEMINFDDITYTLEYRDYERDMEFNTPEWQKTKEKLKARQEEREYQKMLSNNNSGVKKKNNFSILAPGESVKDFEQSMSFGVSFIFSLFLSGLSGYYFGIYCLGLNTNKALFVAAFATIATIILETTLFMIKIGRKTQQQAKAEKNKDKIL